MRRIGLYMGNFNPPHIGHLEVIRLVVESEAFDEIFVVPSYRTLDPKYNTLFTDRITMCKKAFKPFKGVTVSNRESLLASMDLKSYNRNGVPMDMVIDSFKKIQDTEVYLIFTYLEVDNLVLNGRKDILYNNNLALIPCELAEPERIEFIDNLPSCIKISNVVDMGIESCLIRCLAFLGSPLYPLVPKEVEDYIKKHDLYGR